MDLQEVLKKQKERGFKKISTASNTLSINDYLSDPHASRPYIEENSTPVTLAVIKKEVAISEEKAISHRQMEQVAKVADVADALNKKSPVKTPVDTADPTSENNQITTAHISSEHLSISDTTATQQFVSATQKVQSETQEVLKATQQFEITESKATQKVRSATQTATQQLHKNGSKMGRPKIASFDYTSLVGNELNITNEIYSECLKSKSLETDFIEKNEFSQRVKVKLGAIRTSCARLRSKGVLDDFIATKGRGSAWKFVLSENIYHQIALKNSLKIPSISDTNSDTTILSSRSSNINKTTTTQLPADWKKIEYAQLQQALNVYSERFGIAQIKNIYAEAGELISATDVQTSINNFTIGLNNFIKKPFPGIYDRRVKIATLLECLKNGEVFIDPKVEAIKEAEAKRIEAEKRKEMAEQYFEPKFEYYFSSLSDEQMIALVPDSWKTNAAWEHAIKSNNVLLQKSYAKDFTKEYFTKNIWPSILEDLLKD